MSRSFNTKISGDQLAVEARTGLGTGGITTNADGALAVDWDVVGDKATVSAAISTETSVRLSADSSLSSRVSVEVSERTSGVSSVAANLSTELLDRASGDADNAALISTEESVRLVAVSSLVDVYTAEASSRVSGDAALNTNVTTEASLRQAADVALQEAIDSEASLRSGTDSWIVGNLSVETSQRIFGDDALTSSLSVETDARVAGDSSIVVRVSAIEAGLVSGIFWKGSYATTGDMTDALALITPVAGWAYYVTSGNDAYVIVEESDGDVSVSGWSGFSLIKFADFAEIAGIQADINASISTETSSRISGDASLTSRVSVEASTRVVGNASIVAVADADRSLRVSGDESLTVALSGETSLRVAGDSSLTVRIGAEETARYDAVISLADALNTESVNRTNADDALGVRVDSEESLRAAADSSLTVRLAAEESTRTAKLNDMASAHSLKKFLGRVGEGLTAYAAATNIMFDTCGGALLRTADFNLGNDIINMNIGEGVWTGIDALPVNLSVMINGVMLRPVIASNRIKTFVDSETIDFTGLSGDFVFYKDAGGTIGIAFAFALVGGDEVQVAYFNDK